MGPAAVECSNIIIRGALKMDLCVFSSPLCTRERVMLFQEGGVMHTDEAE